jgi:hypothetical protein
MKWTGEAARRGRRAAGQAAALSGMLAVSGLAAGAASASGNPSSPPSATDVSLTYQCRFATGRHPVTVGVTARLPALAKVGKPIKPAAVTLTMALPPAAVSALASLHSTTVNAATRLTVSESEGPAGTSAVWPGVTAHPVHRPAHGGLTLTAAGTAPSVTASSPGDVVLTAAGLSVSFTAGRAATPEPGPARPVAPAAGTANVPAQATPGAGGTTTGPSPSAALRVPCELAKGQQATLATVAVAGPAARHSRHSAAVTLCPGFPTNGLKLNPRFKPPKPPVPIKPVSAPEAGCAYTTGYADARKLQGAALLQPGLTYVSLFVRVLTDFDPKVNYVQFDNAAQLNFHGLHEFPPSTATFLTFGFVPTTATIALIEHGTIDIFAVGPANKGFCKPKQPCATIATVASRLSVRILPGTVKVNGVPLDVGSHCESAPFDAIVTGSDESNPPYIVTTGGPLTGMVNIPKFSHCGAGEDLDPIFNAAISGPRNFNLLTQGGVCFVLGGGTCDNKTGLPVPPTPLRKVTG